jgi:hypothetical protein
MADPEAKQRARETRYLEKILADDDFLSELRVQNEQLVK